MAGRKAPYPRPIRLRAALAAEVWKLIEAVIQMADEDLPRAVQAILSPEGKNFLHDDAVLVVVDRLLCAIRAANERVRHRAAIVLTEIGPPAVGLLALHLAESTDPVYRIRLIKILAAIGPRARAPVARCLIAALINQEDPQICRAVWNAIMELGPAPAVPSENASASMPANDSASDKHEIDGDDHSSRAVEAKERLANPENCPKFGMPSL